MKSLADRIARLFDESYDVAVSRGVGGGESPIWVTVAAESSGTIIYVQAHLVTSRALQAGIAVSGPIEAPSDLFLLFSGATPEEIEDNAYRGISHHVDGLLKLAALAKAQALEKLADELDSG